MTFALVAAAEVARAARLLNLLFGAWLLVAPWVLGGFTAGARWNDMAAGVALVALSLPRGRVRGQYGAWQTYIV